MITFLFSSLREAEDDNSLHCTHLRWCLSTIVLVIRGKCNLCMYSGELAFKCMHLSGSVQAVFRRETSELASRIHARDLQNTRRERSAENQIFGALVLRALRLQPKLETTRGLAS